MKDLPLSRVMTRPLVTVAPDASLDAAKTLMEQHRVHHLLVVEGGRMVGILSTADLLKVALLQPAARAGEPASGQSFDIRVRDLMESHVAVLRESASLKDAAHALTLGGFHALPILAVDDAPVGIVTSSDLVGLLIDQIERDASGSVATEVPSPEAQEPAILRLREVLRAAEVYLNSGQSDQQHARLTRAVERAREVAVGTENPLRL
jgi:acetoin utilization protein AcuB